MYLYFCSPNVHRTSPKKHPFFWFQDAVFGDPSCIPSQGQLPRVPISPGKVAKMSYENKLTRDLGSRMYSELLFGEKKRWVASCWMMFFFVGDILGDERGEIEKIVGQFFVVFQPSPLIFLFLFLGVW